MSCRNILGGSEMDEILNDETIRLSKDESLKVISAYQDIESTVASIVYKHLYLTKGYRPTNYEQKYVEIDIEANRICLEYEYGSHGCYDIDNHSCSLDYFWDDDWKNTMNIEFKDKQIKEEEAKIKLELEKQKDREKREYEGFLKLKAKYESK